MTPPTAAAPLLLVVAGSDPLGYSGFQADLRHAAAAGVAGLGVPTCLTEQSRSELLAVHAVSEAHVSAAIALALEDGPPAAAKLGLLHRREVVQVVARGLAAASFPVVLDPVLASGGGAELAAAGTARALREDLIPRVHLVTPNLPELDRLAGPVAVEDPGSWENAARTLLADGAGAVLVKGGHGGGARSVDLLVEPSGVTRLEAPRTPGLQPRGTGCALATLTAAFLAQGAGIQAAVSRAHGMVQEACARARATGTRRLLVAARPAARGPGGSRPGSP